MSREPAKSEKAATDLAEAMPAGDEPAVREKLEAIRHAKRTRMRWTLSRHTAERAIVAIAGVQASSAYQRSSKSRRRKRRKRLL
ncbi:MAG TPA: hypothetical protein VFK16_03275 [Gemmatimonadaceae bacterium]|jgi:hypothetical protein|nr:hypothetical protein [Gemmatimonadaceae bacterium]